ncbi:MAG: hypothetical protein Q4C70_05740 [Planctomycetia bacterium]|nr:hypothetical protein [Planctomycetia bacterium]
MRQSVCKILFFTLVSAIAFSVSSVTLAQMPYTTTKTNDCGAGVGAPQGRVGLRRIADPEGGWKTKGFIIDSFGPMPQTAYDPNFGCYPGNQRTIHRYPAFHGNYYSSPSNYRHYAEYPWNADMAEPRPYPNQAALRQVGSEVIISTEVVTPAPQYTTTPQPTPAPALEPVSEAQVAPVATPAQDTPEVVPMTDVPTSAGTIDTTILD